MSERKQELERVIAEREAEIATLRDIIKRQQSIEDRYEELQLRARRCWRYYKVDPVLFDAAVGAMNFVVECHKTEIDEMDEK